MFDCTRARCRAPNTGSDSACSPSRFSRQIEKQRARGDFDAWSARLDAAGSMPLQLAGGGCVGAHSRGQQQIDGVHRKPMWPGRIAGISNSKNHDRARRAPAIDTVVLAFAADPVARWTWPQSRQYLAAMPRLVRAFGGRAFTHAGAYCTDEYIGAALWLPPGVHPDEEAMGEVMQSTVSPSLRDEVFATFEQMAKYHPSQPHW